MSRQKIGSEFAPAPQSLINYVESALPELYRESKIIK